MEAAKNYVVFNGKNLRDYGLVFSGAGTHGAPARDFSTVAIPGKDGDLYIDNGRYLNARLSYHVGVKKPVDIHLRDLRNFLLTQKGYKRLEDSYHPDTFRIAMYSGGVDPEVSVRGRIGEIDLVFNCKPQRFLKSGEEPVEFTANGILYNRTMQNAKPLLRVYGTGAGTVGIGSETITISAISSYVDIDCEIMDAYKGAVNCNGNVSFTDDIVLGPGENNISKSGNISKVVITPRWWII
jgi:phage-related protein